MGLDRLFLSLLEVALTSPASYSDWRARSHS